MKFSFVSNDGKESLITTNSVCWAGTQKIFNYASADDFHFFRTYFNSPSYTNYNYTPGHRNREDPTNILNIISEIFPEEKFIKEWYNTFLPDPDKEYSDPYLDVPLEFNTNKAYMALIIARYAFDNPDFTALFNIRINELKERKLPINNFLLLLLATSGVFSWPGGPGGGHGIQNFLKKPRYDALDNLKQFINSNVKYTKDTYQVKNKKCIGTGIFNCTIESTCFTPGPWAYKTWLEEYEQLLVMENK